MARLESIMQMGYYPTDLDVARMIADHIRLSGSAMNSGVVFDPCAGGGKAVTAFTNQLNRRFDDWPAVMRCARAKTSYFEPKGYDSSLRWSAYGVELDTERAGILVETLGSDYAVQAAFEQVSLKAGSRSADIVFLNPPYDNVNGRRVEPRFVKRAWPFLSSGGLMVLIVPEFFLDRPRARAELIKACQGQVSKTTVLRFPEPAYQQWKQVVILMTKGSGYLGERDLRVVGTVGENKLSPNDSQPKYNKPGYDRDDRLLYIDVSRYGRSRYVSGPMPTFDLRVSVIKPAVSVFRDDAQAVFDKCAYLIGDPNGRSSQGQSMSPILEIGEPHAAMVAAAGHLNGLTIQRTVMLDDGTEIEEDFLVCGSSYKREVTRTTEKKGADGKKVVDVITAEEYAVRLAFMNMTSGKTDVYDSAGDNVALFEEVFLKHAKAFTATARAMYPPRLSGEELDLACAYVEKWIHAPSKLKGHDNGLFIAQRERVAAILKMWKREKGVILDGEMSCGKTVISLAAAALAAVKRDPGNRVVFVVVPPKADLLRKWAREAKLALRDLNPTVYTIGLKLYPVPVNAGKAVSDLAREFWGAETLDGTSLSTLGTEAIYDALRAGKCKDAKGIAVGRLSKKALGRVFRMRKCPMREIDAAFAERGLTIVIAKTTTIKLGSTVQDVELTQRPRFDLVGDYYTMPPQDVEVGAQLTEKLQEVTYRGKPGYAVKGKDGWKVYKKGFYAVCPLCGKPVINDPDVLGVGLRRKCPECEGGLWTYVAEKSPNYPLATYVRDRFLGRYILIVDEAHRAKGMDTAISFAVTNLASSAYKILQMTGTLINGLASSLFMTLYRMSSDFRSLYSHDGVQEFINHWGLWQELRRTTVKAATDLASGYKRETVRKDQRPGVHPGMVGWMFPRSTFLSLYDLAFNMPDYSEHTLFVDMDPKLSAAVSSYLSACKDAAIEAWKEGDNSPMGGWRMAKVAVPNIPFGPDHISDKDGNPVAVYNPPDVPRSTIFAKEEAFLRLVWDAKERGRKVMCFVGQIVARDPTSRLISLLARYGMKGVVMRSKVAKRVEFLNNALAEGADVVFCSPGLVSEGIDLPMFATAIWITPNFNMFVTPQANRRFFRLSQTMAVEIYYLAYNDMPETVAFVRIAEKAAAQQALRGDIRAGLARLLSQDTFVTRLQDAVEEECQHFESDISVSDLPALPTKAELRAAKAKRVVVEKLAPEPVAAKPSPSVTKQLTIDDLLKKYGLTRRQAVGKKKKPKAKAPAPVQVEQMSMF